MDAVKTLIDKWTETRTQRLLARLLRVSDQRVSDWKTGKRPMPDAVFATVAELVEGEEVAKELTWQYVRRNVSVMEKISEGFRTLLSLAKRRNQRVYVAG